jgi:hypothetical protein
MIDSGSDRGHFEHQARPADALGRGAVHRGWVVREGCALEQNDVAALRAHDGRGVGDNASVGALDVIAASAQEARVDDLIRREPRARPHVRDERSQTVEVDVKLAALLARDQQELSLRRVPADSVQELLE